MKDMWEERYAADEYAHGEKALRLAERHGVHINYEVADYETARIEPEAYDVVALPGSETASSATESRGIRLQASSSLSGEP